METPITKETLRHLAYLSRIKVDPEKEEKILADLRGILEHFEELKEIPTDEAAPVVGGSFAKNVFRSDDPTINFPERDFTPWFPDSYGTFLCVPPVFGENEESV